jgi:hypothetical protein
MKREAKLLLCKAIDSVTLAVELFNRPVDYGRATAVLIMLDHASEMLLKAAIVHRGGEIRKTKETQTIGFNECVRRGISDGHIKFLSDEQALLLQMNNGLRDAAQHYLVDVSEQQLYFQTQAGVTMFRDLLHQVFGIDLYTKLPMRVLPISSTPPTSLDALFHNQVEEIERLLRPGSRRRVQALAKLRALAITEGALRGSSDQPGDGDLRRLSKAIRAGQSWEILFPGVASLETTTSGFGPAIDFRLSKKEGIDVHVVPEGTPGAVLVFKRVDELGYYNLSPTQLANKVGLTPPKATAMVRYLKLRGDPECFKEVVMGKSHFPRYSQKAITTIKEALTAVNVDEVWRDHGPRRK